MRGVRVWKRLAGVDDRTVVEDVGFDEAADAVVVSVRPRRPKRRRCGYASGGRRAMTKVAGGAAGGGWTLGRSPCAGAGSGRP